MEEVLKNFWPFSIYRYTTVSTGFQHKDDCLKPIVCKHIHRNKHSVGVCMIGKEVKMSLAHGKFSMVPTKADPPPPSEYMHVNAFLVISY